MKFLLICVLLVWSATADPLVEREEDEQGNGGMVAVMVMEISGW